MSKIVKNIGPCQKNDVFLAGIIFFAVDFTVFNASMFKPRKGTVFSQSFAQKVLDSYCDFSRDHWLKLEAPLFDEGE